MADTYITDGKILYTLFSKYKTVQTGTNSISMMEAENKLVKINLETGKYEEIADAMHKNIIGVYDNNIILKEVKYYEDPQNSSMNISENLNKSKIKIKLLNLSTLQETNIYEDSYKNLSQIYINASKIYYMGEGSNKIEEMDIETKEKGILQEVQKAPDKIIGIYDNKLQYVYYNNSSDGVTIDKAYYIDLQTKENKEFKLVDKYKNLVEILAQTNEYYFVLMSYEMTGNHTTWAGTVQNDIIGENYGLIKKDDYWKSNPEFSSIQK